MKHYKFCTRENCNEKHYAKGLCRKHYARKIFNRKKNGQCPALNCKIKTINNIYCSRHKKRIDKGHPLDLNIKLKASGIKNGMWKGGIFEYKNHYQMKKIREEIMNKRNYKCESCGQRATEIHHKDKTKTNHNIDNLIVLCHKCHMGIYHKGESGRHKMFGNIGLVKLSKNIRISPSSVKKYIKGEKLSKRIFNIIKKKIDNNISLVQ